MAIITHPLVRQPLEKWFNMLFAWLGMMAIRIGLDKEIERQKPRKHHGAALLLTDFNSSKYQDVLAAAIVWERGKGTARTETPAIFIQKIREWTDVNEKNGNSDTRPYRSYQEWCDKNFPAQNFESMQRVVESLEKLGLLITEADPENGGRKRYAVNEAAVHDLIERWAAAHPKIAAHFRSMERRLPKESPRLDSESPRLDPSQKGLDNESDRLSNESQKGSNQFPKNAVHQAGIKRQPTSGSRGAARSLFEALLRQRTDSHSHNTSDQGDYSNRTTLDDNAPQSERTAVPHPGSAVPSPSVPGAELVIGTGSIKTPMDVYTTAHHQLSLLFDRPSFDMWLKTAALQRFELVDGTGVYTVGVPTAHAQDMLQHRYYRKVQRVFEGLQNHPVSITFAVLPPPKPVQPIDDDIDDAPVLRILREAALQREQANRNQERSGQRWNRGRQWRH